MMELYKNSFSLMPDRSFALYEQKLRKMQFLTDILRQEPYEAKKKIKICYLVIQRSQQFVRVITEFENSFTVVGF